MSAAPGPESRRRGQPQARQVFWFLSRVGSWLVFSVLAIAVGRSRCRVTPDYTVAPDNAEACIHAIAPHHGVAPDDRVGIDCRVAPDDGVAPHHGAAPND